MVAQQKRDLGRVFPTKVSDQSTVMDKGSGEDDERKQLTDLAHLEDPLLQTTTSTGLDSLIVALHE